MAAAQKLKNWTDGIEFLGKYIEHADSIGEVTFFSEGRYPGRIMFGNEVRHFQDRFESRFAEGYVARSPGLVDEQEITVLLDGRATPVIYEHHREIGTAWFGYRPIIEVETPDGQHWHFSYRPTLAGNAWFQVVPLNEYTPYGSLRRHLVRIVDMLIEVPYRLAWNGVVAAAATAVAGLAWMVIGAVAGGLK